MALLLRGVRPPRPSSLARACTAPPACLPPAPAPCPPCRPAPRPPCRTRPHPELTGIRLTCCPRPAPPRPPCPPPLLACSLTCDTFVHTQVRNTISKLYAWRGSSFHSIYLRCCTEAAAGAQRIVQRAARQGIASTAGRGASATGGVRTGRGGAPGRPGHALRPAGVLPARDAPARHCR